ncbi:MAG TPA: hypothetical protein VK003_20485 [Oceanobacillus sp.]|nr:hypothetical protein [Oceanobacillus sp.]
MSKESIFSEDWRECLRAHYMYVVREQDVKTERTLRGVMHNIGFGDDELNELRVLATMHVDQVGTDFVPDLRILEETTETVEATDEAPQPEEPAPEIVDDLDATVPDSIEPAEEEITQEEPYEEPPQPDDSGPAQLSLF